MTPKDAKLQAEKIAGSKGSTLSLLASVMKYLADPRVRKEVVGLLERLGLMVAMIKDYFNGRYRRLPFNTLVALIAALIYFVSPVDAIPDVIPGIGFLDDAGVIAIVFMNFNKDITAYENWLEGNGAQ
ncbi:YkvA family protein [uncultured Mesotoga sp.]|uniref:YkvA family protein n=1 Tax=uncultured Mesotoga sp. TaxID=1184400 RepID=UPI00259A40C1|nr:YkvA family protein [uncultured Mesotoga sp.]HPD38719.1 YkvA family protein [Mesotoga infera]